MASFRFELNGRHTKNKTYVVYLRITVAGKRKLIKTNIEVTRPSDFNAKCKGGSWIRSTIYDAKVRNEYLADLLAKAKDKYKDLDNKGDVSSVCFLFSQYLRSIGFVLKSFSKKHHLFYNISEAISVLTLIP